MISRLAFLTYMNTQALIKKKGVDWIFHSIYIIALFCGIDENRFSLSKHKC